MKNTKGKKYIFLVPPWIIIGAVMILAPIFVFVAVENIQKQKESMSNLLLEKGAALIRSFEAGARTGVMGMRWGGSQIQKLLTETAEQPDITYLIITDTSGRVLAHNNPQKIGTIHGKGLNLRAIARSKDLYYREIEFGDKKTPSIFEVVRRFAPTRGQVMLPLGSLSPDDWFMMMKRREKQDFDFIIFVGMNMDSVEAARKEEARNTLIMAIILLLIGFTGVVLLFMTERYRSARSSLSKIKAFSDNLVENMPIGLISLDSSGKITSCNQTAESILNISAHGIQNQEANQILVPQVNSLIETLKSTGKTIEKEMLYPLDSDTTIPIEIIATVLEDENDTRLGYVLLIRDLTEIQGLRKEIERSQRLASLGRLAAGVAHEIRNPLSSIKGFATYFNERYKDVPEDQKIADIMIQEVDRLNRVITQLLEFARPMNIHKKPVSIVPFLQRSIKMVERQAHEKGISIAIDLPHDMGEVAIDQDRMNQVFLNLYLNAIEAMEKGGNLSVKLFKNNNAKSIKICIVDTGKGIEEKDMTKIFEPYFTTKPSGTGLGLAIVHRIIEAHQGNITAKSHPDHETVVTITLPIFSHTV